MSRATLYRPMHELQTRGLREPLQGFSRWELAVTRAWIICRSCKARVARPVRGRQLPVTFLSAECTIICLSRDCHQVGIKRLCEAAAAGAIAPAGG